MKMLSEAERIACLAPGDRAAWFARYSANALLKKEQGWEFWCRPNQKMPGGDWRIWLVLAGRGFGKTRMGAEWVRGLAEARGGLRIALVGATMAEVRSIMVEGQSGVLTTAPDRTRPHWEPSLKRLTWKNGTIAELYSAAEPDSLRGGEHHFAWADEIAKWPAGEAAWQNMMLALRLGRHPQILATTTPRPIALIRQLMKSEGVAITRGSTMSNRSQLPATFLDAMQATYGGTRIGRQELEGEVIEDREGALWTRDLIEKCRVPAAPVMKRVVIGVDPPAGTNGDACGIVVVGVGDDDHAYVLADNSVLGKSPEGWARAVANAADIWGADRVVAEGNQGGAMVESTLRGANFAMPIKRVFASVGKVARAEPVVALYETGRVHHVGSFPALEDELCGLIIGGGYQGPGRSPDRADALVWAVSELMLGRVGMPRVSALTIGS